MLQMRAAARGVGDDRVKLLRRNLVDLLARELLRQCPFAVVGVQRSAAELPSRGDNLATVLRQNFRRVAIDVAKNQVLRATGQERNTVAAHSDCWSNRRDQLLREFGLHLWRHCFQFAEPFGK